MFNLTGTEVVVILLLALVVLGPEKLPDAIRRFGRTYSELKKLSTGFQQEFRSALDEPMREMRDSADLLRRSVDFSVDRAPDLGPADDRPTADVPTSELPFTESPAPAESPGPVESASPIGPSPSNGSVPSSESPNGTSDRDAPERSGPT